MKRPVLAFTLLVCTATLMACNEHHHYHHHHDNGVSDDQKTYLDFKAGDGSIGMNEGNVVIRAGGQSDDAYIGPDGSFKIGERTVETSAAGRAALKQYNANAVAFRDNAISLGIEGANFGLETAGKVIGGLFDGTADEEGRKADRGAKELEKRAHELCDRLGEAYTTQQTAAAAVTAFKPYAVISQHQVDDCRKDRAKDDKDIRDEDHDEDNDDDHDSSTPSSAPAPAPSPAQAPAQPQKPVSKSGHAQDNSHSAQPVRDTQA